MPMNTPQAKKPVVASCSHSHGLPISRVTTSQNTDRVKPAIDTPDKIMSRCSSGSSAFHFRWRWLAMTNDLNGCPLAAQTAALAHHRPRDSPESELFHVAYELEDLDRMRPELLGELILDRLRRLYEAGFVDAFDHLDAELLQPLRRVCFKLE